MSSGTMWTSKLGNKYPMALMQQSDQAAQKELKRLRSLRTNSFCFDCGRQDNSWSSVNHGIFMCVVCSDVHRSVGTHITKTKGCTGTYLWGPDELDKMQTIGNQRGEDVYGTEKVSPDASKELKQQHVIDKYEKKLFVRSSKAAPQQSISVVQKMEQIRQKSVPSEPRVAAVTQQRSELTKPVPIPSKAQEISQSLFDELFSEPQQTCLVDEVVVTKPDDSAFKCGQNKLDDFLDCMLQAEAKPTVLMNASLLASAAPHEGVKATGPPIEDPFFDWTF